MADADLRYLIDAVDKGFSTTMSKVSKQLDETHGHLTDFNEKGLNATAKHMGGVNKGVMGVTGGMKMMGAAALAGGAALGGIAFAKLAGEGMAMAQTLESSASGFETMLGSAEKAQAFVKEMSNFAAKTPFEFPELAQSAQTMMAFGWAAEDVIPTMTKVGDAVGAMGKGSEGVDRVITALGQMKAKGKVSAEEMMQLTEVGIPAWQMLADKIGITVPEAQKRAQKGQLDLDTTMTAIIDGMGTKYAGGMEKQAQTISGMMSTLKDNVGLALANVVTPVLPLIKEMVGGFSKFAEVAGPKVGEMMANIAPKIKMVFEYFKGLGEKILPALKGWWDKVSEAIDKNRPGLEMLGQAFVGVAKFIAEKVIPILIDFSGKYLSNVLAVLGKVGEYLPTLGRIFLEFASNAAENMGDLFDVILAGVEWMLKGLGSLPGKIGQPFRDAAIGVEQFRDRTAASFATVIKSMDNAQGALQRWGEEAKKPREIKIKENLADLETKLAAAKESLNDPNLTKERKAEIKGDITDLLNKVKAARIELAKIQNKTVLVRVTTATMTDSGDVNMKAGYARQIADAANAVKKAEADAAADVKKITSETAAAVVSTVATAAAAGAEGGKTAVKKAAAGAKKAGPDLRAAFDQVMGQIADAVEATRSKLVAFNEAAANLGRSISRGLGTFGEGVADWAKKMAEAVAPDQMLANMRASVAAIDGWRASLAQVAARGLPQNIVEELRAMGLESADELQALNGMTDQQLQEFAGLWRTRDESGAVEGAKQYADDIAAELAALPGTLKTIGEQAMAGLAAGLGSQAGVVGDQALAAIADIVSKINDEDDLLTITFEYEFVPKGEKKKKPKKKKATGKGGMGGGDDEDVDGFSVGHGLLAATAGAGSAGAKFAQWGPYWSWNRNPRTGMGQHDGADVSVGHGTRVYATKSGRIVDTGTSGWAGNHVVWEADGTRYLYAHLSSIAKYSGSVRAGTMLGRVGSTGNSTGPHLHVQASRNGSYVNPAYYLEDGGIVKRRPGGTLAVIGEGRYDEAVVPLKNGTGGVGGDLHVHFEGAIIGSREDLARYVTEAQLDYKRRRGTLLGLA